MLHLRNIYNYSITSKEWQLSQEAGHGDLLLLIVIMMYDLFM